MPKTADEIETMLINAGRQYEKPEGQKDTLLVPATSGPIIAMRVVPPVVAINVAIGPAPQDDVHALRFFRRLLELNATDLMHAAYGLERGNIILAAALALENLDANELEATLSDIDLALARHTKELAHTAKD